MAVIGGEAYLASLASISARISSEFYRYTPSGGITLGCRAVYSQVDNVPTFYEVGEIWYICYRARNYGRLEAVAIKKIDINTRSGQGVPTYVDTFNGIWGDGDLCTLAGAQALVAIYDARQDAILRRHLEQECI